MLGSIVRSRRKTLGLKQRELAADAGISRPYLSQIENNRPGSVTVGVLQGLARALHIEDKVLLDAAMSEGHLQEAPNGLMPLCQAVLGEMPADRVRFIEGLLRYMLAEVREQQQHNRSA